MASDFMPATRRRIQSVVPGSRGLSKGLSVGVHTDAAGDVVLLEGGGKPLSDLLIVAFRLKYRKLTPVTQYVRFAKIPAINNLQLHLFAKPLPNRLQTVR